jgi:hypothetical protein
MDRPMRNSFLLKCQDTKNVKEYNNCCLLCISFYFAIKHELSLCVKNLSLFMWVSYSSPILAVALPLLWTLSSDSLQPQFNCDSGRISRVIWALLVFLNSCITSTAVIVNPSTRVSSTARIWSPTCSAPHLQEIITYLKWVFQWTDKWIKCLLILSDFLFKSRRMLCVGHVAYMGRT